MAKHSDDQFVIRAVESRKLQGLPTHSAFGLYLPRVDHYAWYDNDSADEDATTIIGAEDAAQALLLDTDYHLRLKVANLGSVDGPFTKTLQYSVDGGAWADVSAASSNVRVTPGLPNNGAPTSERLTASTRAFQPGEYDDFNAIVGVSNLALTDTEYVFSIIFRSAELAGTETVTFRLDDADVGPISQGPVATAALGGAGVVPASAYAPLKTHVRHQRHRHQVVVPQLWDLPVTAASTSRAPQNIASFVTLKHGSRRLQVLPSQLADVPATPAPAASSGYPGSGGVSAYRWQFKRTLQHLPTHAQWTETSAPAAIPFSAYHRVDALIPRPTAQYLQPTRLSAYEVTDPAYYTGWYPAAFLPQRVQYSEVKWRHLTLPMPESAVLASFTDAVPPAHDLPKQHRRHERRKIVHLPRHDQFTRTVQSPAAYAPVTALRRRDTARILQFPPIHDRYPVTATSAAQPPAFFPVQQFRRHGRTRLVSLPQYPDIKVEVFPSVIKDAVNHVWYWDRYRRCA